MAKLNDEFGPFDIVLDDGSHIMPNVRASFSYLYPRMSRNGVYLIEDLHTAYWEKFGGGYRAEGSFIEYAKNLIDELNGDAAKKLIDEVNGDAAKGQFEPTEFTRTCHSICFYPTIVCFERGHHFARLAPRIGKMLDETKSDAEETEKAP